MKISEAINNIIKDLNNISDTVIIYNKIESDIVIEKNNTHNKILKKDFIESNKIIKENINNKIKSIYIKEIINFIDVLNNKLSSCNFDNINNNIPTLEIIDKIPLFLKSHIFAAYNPYNNQLYINKKNYKKYISHELLHMSSSKKINKDYICSGFTYTNIKLLKKHGTFINEGYTEYLNNKYLVNLDDTKYYKLNRSFIELLIIIIGEELMQQLYFNADFKGLIKELMKYNNSLENVVNFIINTDIVHDNIFELSIIKRIKLKKALLEVNKFLIDTYYEKVKTYAKDENEINIEMNDFMSLLSTIKLDIGYNEKYIKEKKLNL